MKSKAKPAKGSARTKRFDVGGTVGALAGLGTLAYLMSRKKKGEDGKAEYKPQGKFPSEDGSGTSGSGDTTTKVDDAGRQRALDQSKDPRLNYMPDDSDRKELYSDINAKRTDGGKTTPVVKKKPASSTTTTTSAAKSKTGQGSSTTTGVDAGIAAGQQKKSDKLAAPTLKPGESRVTGEGTLKPYPAAAAAKKKAEVRASKYTTPGDPNAKGSTQRGRSANPIQGTIDNATRSTVRSDTDKMRERALEVERRRKEENKKAGGAVKKYAAGGSVKASGMGSVKTAKPSMGSASKRADGIAQRGKTRGKVC
jgi:hypothetical protein